MHLSICAQIDAVCLSSWFQGLQWQNATVSSPESAAKLLASGAGFKREEVSFSHRVAEHVSAPFFLPGTATPLTFPCCLRKQSSNKTFLTFWAFCSQMTLYANLTSVLCLMKGNVQVWSAGRLLFTLRSSFWRLCNQRLLCLLTASDPEL